MAAPRPRHLFLTGFPGAGKTTCVLAALDALVAACGEASILGGFVTREVRDDATGARLGFDVHTLPPSRSRRHPLARRVADHPSETARDDAPNPHVVGAYAVDVRGALERVVVPNLREICSEEPEPSPSPRGNPTPTPTPTRAAPRGAVSVVVIDEAGKMESSPPRSRPPSAPPSRTRVVVLGVVPVGRKVNVARDAGDDPSVRCVTLDEGNRDGLARAIGEALVRCVRSNEPEIRLEEGGGEEWGDEDATTRGSIVVYETRSSSSPGSSTSSNSTRIRARVNGGAEHGAAASRAARHSLHPYFRLPCSQKAEPPHSLHWLRCLPCSQI